jgi:protocatechuate 3,4-dioxygenase, alpha subunit
MSMAASIPTPGQTVGPFFHYGMEYPQAAELVPPRSPGSVQLRGTVYDGAGDPVPDAQLEIWQADEHGTIVRTPGGAYRRDGGAFSGFGRASTDAAGVYRLWTVEPGPVDGGAPFFAAILFARGLPTKLHTRIYLPGEAAHNDAFLASMPEHERATLIAHRDDEGRLVHDIHLQGDRETVFLAF